MTDQSIPILKLMGSFRHPLSTNCGNISTNHEGEVKGRDVQLVAARCFLIHCNFETTSDINEESGLSCEKAAVDAAFRAFLGPHQHSQSAWVLALKLRTASLFPSWLMQMQLACPVTSQGTPEDFRYPLICITAASLESIGGTLLLSDRWMNAPGIDFTNVCYQGSHYRLT